MTKVQLCEFGPQGLPNKVTGRNYKAFLENNMPDFLADVPLIIHRELHFMHDGAPAHFSLVARKYLIPGRWIGTGGSIAWPPRSSDLNPLDLYLWDHLKTLMYLSPVDDVKALRNRIVSGFQIIRDMQGI
jgi:hypothetical protein